MKPSEDVKPKDEFPCLSTPHEKFPSMGRVTLFDRVTSMYLDTGDDAEIARTLSEELGTNVTPDTVAEVRKEAAMVAEKQPPEIRRKWIYRYKILTVNNIVKEYMFIEGKHNFVRAKREFAEEIEALVQKTPSDRLWIAINDALGRNNISIELVYELLAYGRTARKLEKLVQAYADSRLLTTEEGMRDVSMKVRRYCDEENDSAKRIRFAAKLIEQNEKLLTMEDTAFLVEYGRFAMDSVTPEPNFTNRILRGADVFVKPPSILEQLLLGDVSKHLSSAELPQVILALRSTPLMTKPQLEQVLSYARRHIDGIEIMKKLGTKDQKPEQVQVMVMKALQSLQKVVEDHLCIVDATSFLSNHELGSAASGGMNIKTLEAKLAELNRLPSLEAVIKKLSEPSKATFVFPADKYCMKRFGTAGPFAKR